MTSRFAAKKPGLDAGDRDRAALRMNLGNILGVHGPRIDRLPDTVLLATSLRWNAWGWTNRDGYNAWCRAWFSWLDTMPDSRLQAAESISLLNGQAAAEDYLDMLECPINKIITIR